MIAQRMGLSKCFTEEASAAICIKLENFTFANKHPNDNIVASYLAIDNEPDLSQLVKRLNLYGNLIALPAISHDRLNIDFFIWKPGNQLKSGPFNKLLEPKDCTSSKKIIPHVVLAPIIACDKAGHRLGYGKGYYDKAIYKLRPLGSTFIGVAYDFQLTDSIPTEPHDQPLDAIVTEKRVLHFG
jgi:5-formyltetrahydrofolate cyclo-ligase